MPQQLPLEEEIDDFYEHLIDLFGRDVYKVTHPLHRAFRQYQEIKKEMESESESEDEVEDEYESEEESEHDSDSDYNSFWMILSYRYSTENISLNISIVLTNSSCLSLFFSNCSCTFSIPCNIFITIFTSSVNIFFDA